VWEKTKQKLFKVGTFQIQNTISRQQNKNLTNLIAINIPPLHSHPLPRYFWEINKIIHNFVKFKCFKEYVQLFFNFGRFNFREVSVFIITCLSHGTNESKRSKLYLVYLTSKQRLRQQSLLFVSLFTSDHFVCCPL
jgi:hypothetical protein